MMGNATAIVVREIVKVKSSRLPKSHKMLRQGMLAIIVQKDNPWLSTK